MNRTSLLMSAAFGAGILSIGMPHAEAQTSCMPSGSSTLGSPPPTTVGSYCSVGITSYSHTCTLGTSSVTSGTVLPVGSALSNGSTLNTAATIICAADFADAMTDAGTYFSGSPSGSNGFQLTVGSGTFYVPDTSVSGQAIINLPASSTSSPPSTSERLVIEGSTSGSPALSTTIISNYGLKMIEANPPDTAFSHFTVDWIHFDRDASPTFQGDIVSVTSVTETVTVSTTIGGTTTITGSSNVTATALEIAVKVNTIGSPGFGTPDLGFQAPQAAGNSKDQQFIRIYDNINTDSIYTPVLDHSSVSGTIPNKQVFFHGVCGGTGAAFLPVVNLDDAYESDVFSAGTTTTLSSSFTCPTSGSTYTLLLGQGSTLTNTGTPSTSGTIVPGTLTSGETGAVDWYSAGLSGATNPTVCGKNEGGSGAFLTINNGTTTLGSDIVLDHLLLTGNGQSNIFDTTGITVSNSSIAREPGYYLPALSKTQVPCLATDTGGVEINGGTMGTYGNTVSNVTFTATGDDSIAFFADIGGTGSYPVSSVTNATIHDSFARGVLVNQTASEPSLCSSVDVYPYAGYSSSGSLVCGGMGSGLCSGNGYNMGIPGFNTATMPYPAADRCPDTSGGGSLSNTITNIYAICPTASFPSATGSLAFCPVRGE